MLLYQVIISIFILISIFSLTFTLSLMDCLYDLIFLITVDKRYHTPEGAWDSEQHVTQGTKILIDSIKEIKAKFPQWTQEQCFKGGISAYNAGVKNVRTYERMDVGTTGGDYSNDVVARAQWYKSKGY
ncbi:Lysozyme g [Anabarilius grahami]|uniref:Lysozyme g n=1 Tax=Anabarilius grahami TaxID=495550 RepID=A0A3N0YLX6_ANAGA|nr:Lysozyme g [Anabarilius grahami]